MDRQQIGIALGLVLLCGVLWLAGDNESAGGSNLADTGALGLLALGAIVVVRLLKRPDQTSSRNSSSSSVGSRDDT